MKRGISDEGLRRIAQLTETPPEESLQRGVSYFGDQLFGGLERFFSEVRYGEIDREEALAIVSRYFESVVYTGDLQRSIERFLED